MLCIKNGRIHDLVKEEPYVADILVKDGKIAAIGEHLEADGAEAVSYTHLVWVNPVYKVKIEPNTATETAARIIVCIWLPSQTISRGARADFGRLFNMTR